MSRNARHHGMSDKVARALGYAGEEPKYGPETAPCPRCGEALQIGTVRETGQTLEKCKKCGYVKVHRGRLTTE